MRERLSHGGRLWPALSVVAGLALVLLTASSTAQSQRTNERAGARDGYVDADACAGCHSEIWETYRQTGMGRSFARMTPASVQADFAQDNIYHHQASGRHYKAYQRDGKFYLRRHQINADGAEVNVVDKEIHYVVGSGNHARSYLHRTPDHRLLQMPLTWYSAEGGYWAMSPGYDQPNHVGFRRVVDFECMACHNAYPEIQAGSDIPGAHRYFQAASPRALTASDATVPAVNTFVLCRKAKPPTRYAARSSTLAGSHRNAN